MIEKLLDYIGCLLNSILFRGFGDPTASDGDNTVTGGAWAIITRCPQPCVLMLANTGANAIEIGANEQGKAGYSIPTTQAIVIDNFKGTLYARSTAGASTLNWCKLSQNVSE